MGFIDKLRARWDAADSLVCVGLDPDPAKFPEAFVDDDDFVVDPRLAAEAPQLSRQQCAAHPADA